MVETEEEMKNRLRMIARIKKGDKMNKIYKIDFKICVIKIQQEETTKVR